MRDPTTCLLRAFSEGRAMLHSRPQGVLRAVLLYDGYTTLAAGKMMTSEERTRDA
jgi:hypothetical protein